MTVGGGYQVRLRVNGVDREAQVEPRTTLAELLRTALGLTGTHIGCEHGVCGACTVVVDGESTRSCLMLAVQADGAEVTTVEGLAGADGELHPIQEAFAREHGLQCGFCTPGFLMALHALFAESPDATEDEIVEATRDADYIMVYRAQLTDRVLKSAAKVRLVQLLAAGHQGVNPKLMREMGIPCAQNAGANSWAVADYAVLLMLAVYRRLILVDASTRAGRWRAPVNGLNTYELDGKLVGILGIGNIGSKVARRVQGFGARVQYYDKFPLSPEREQEAGVVRVTLDELFRTSDIVTLHMPLTPETNRLVSREVLAAMKPTAVLINTSRGEIIDEGALTEALQAGRLIGAGLDVYEKEPIDPASPLLKLENVVLSPHSAGTTLDAWHRRLEFAFANMRRVAAGETPLGLVRD